MNFLSLVGVEFKKIKRSKILLILLVATVILWIPSIVNAKMNLICRQREFLRKTIFLFRALWGCHGLCSLQVW